METAGQYRRLAVTRISCCIVKDEQSAPPAYFTDRKPAFSLQHLWRQSSALIRSFAQRGPPGHIAMGIPQQSQGFFIDGQSPLILAGASRRASRV
ncbi:hypothetical protein CLOSTMETH_01988 [[Clostridium] methylpentosum DSM 5476]|uniref:Uncharacterized protein n=1 Tax=[Clostridium] methylpentosum DSM 5476 TaxID=537013 RepID=C0EDR0_9FIRM|nr:hypothetical protein CLOSTMETH_01988 [[Clostridium] methylpentosum DSM 5476]